MNAPLLTVFSLALQRGGVETSEPVIVEPEAASPTINASPSPYSRCCVFSRLKSGYSVFLSIRIITKSTMTTNTMTWTTQ